MEFNEIIPANIEPLKWSIVSHEVKFDNGFGDIMDIYAYRKANLKTTAMYWIKKQPVIDQYYNVYNPMALIFVILN